MAAFTNRNEITLVVRTAVCQRQDMMYFLGGSESAFTLALFAQRVPQ